jgi:hypothetical protein
VCDLNVNKHVTDVTKTSTMLGATEVLLNCTASFAASCHYKLHTVITDIAGVKFATFTLQIYIYLQSKSIYRL